MLEQSGGGARLRQSRELRSRRGGGGPDDVLSIHEKLVVHTIRCTASEVVLVPGGRTPQLKALPRCVA